MLDLLLKEENFIIYCCCTHKVQKFVIIVKGQEGLHSGDIFVVTTNMATQLCEAVPLLLLLHIRFRVQITEQNALALEHEQIYGQIRLQVAPKPEQNVRSDFLLRLSYSKTNVPSARVGQSHVAIVEVTTNMSRLCKPSRPLTIITKL